MHGGQKELHTKHGEREREGGLEKVKGEREEDCEIDVRLGKSEDREGEWVGGLVGLPLGCRQLRQERKCESMGY